jgi:hypothetical protein
MTTEAAAKLPEHKTYDNLKDINDGDTPTWGPCYARSEMELEVLCNWLNNLHETGKIRCSKSLGGSPILFVPKAHGWGLILCVDYSVLNKITIANRDLLPIMSELQDGVRGTRILTNIDLKNGYHLIRVNKWTNGKPLYGAWTVFMS